MRQDQASALLCDPHGNIVQVIRDELNLCGRVGFAARLTAVVAASDLDKARLFLLTLRAQKAAFNWEIHVRLENRLVPLHFAGSMTGNKLLILAARTRSGIARLHEELVSIDNEQMNELQPAIAQLGLKSRASVERDSEFYNELSRLNNELATLQRQLAKKNVELERLNDELERRVETRTAELARTNASLKEEISERKRAEEAVREEARVSQGQTQALAHTLTALTARPSLDTFLGHVLAAIVQQLQVDSVALWLYEEIQDRLSVHMTYDGEHLWSAEPADNPAGLYPLSAGQFPLWQELAGSGRPIVVEEAENDPRVIYRERVMAQGAQSLLLVPLGLAGEIVGCLDLCFVQRHRFRPAEIELAQALSQQVTLALQLTRLAEQAQQSAVLEERNRIARDIHDTLAQDFTGIVLQLEAAKDALRDDPEEVTTHLTQACNLAREGLAEARRSLKILRPQALADTDLPASLERLAGQWIVGRQTRVDFHVHGVPRTLPVAVANNLLRIGQEALTNAGKHARARAIAIDLTFEPHQVQLRVRDDGQGWDCHRPVAGGGFGLTSMRERAEHIGGRLTLTSRPGQGTEVLVVVPTSSLDSLRSLA